MGETRAAIRRLRIYAIILVALTIWGATEPHRDTVAERIKAIITRTQQ